MCECVYTEAAFGNWECKMFVSRDILEGALISSHAR